VDFFIMYKRNKRSISLPVNVDVKVLDGFYYFIGPKGTIKHKLHESLFIEFFDRELQISSIDNFFRKNEILKISALINTTYVLFKNYIYGVVNLFKRELILRGVGYRAIYDKNLSKLKLILGFSHDIIFDVPEDVIVEISDNTVILIKGVSKYDVGQFASNIRAKKIPEIYKGNGIRYKDEIIKLKSPKKSK